MNRIMLWAPLASILLVLAVLAIALLGPERADPDPLSGQPLPELPLEDFPGPLADFDQDTAEGPYLLNVWASWCAPCRIEHPVLMQLAQEGKPIYGLVYKNEPEQAMAFLRELGDPFAGLAADPEGRAGLELGLTGVPETLLIDGAGIVRARWRGAISAPVWNTHFEEEWQAALARAQAQASQASP